MLAIVHQKWKQDNVCMLHALYSPAPQYITRVPCITTQPIHRNTFRCQAYRNTFLDSDEYIIEAILADKGHRKSSPSMTFLVHWQGYDNTADSWEPWQALRKTDALHTYLRSNNLGKYIPLQYRNRNP